MINVLHNRNNRYRSSLLCFIIICVLVAFTAYERPELEKLSNEGSDNVSSITAPGNDFCDIVSDETADYSVIKSIVSKRSAAGRAAGSGKTVTCAAAGGLLILIGTAVLFLLYCYKHLTTSHHFIIAYIHNLDGMKP